VDKRFNALLQNKKMEDVGYLSEMLLIKRLKHLIIRNNC
jgi:hypothetical protein